MPWTWEIPSVLINSLSYLFVAAMGQVSNSSSESSTTKQATGSCQKQREIPRPTSYGKWDGATMSIKAGNFPFQACTAQNWLWMGKYCTYLELNASQGAPKHCQTFDSFTQF